MKHLRKVLLTLLVVASFSSLKAQDANNPWAFDIGTNAVDFYPTNQNAPGIGTWGGRFFAVGAHYNIASTVDRVHVGRYVADGFTVGLAFSFNTVDKLGDNIQDNALSYMATDVDIRYDINGILGETSFIDPYALMGGGYTWLNKRGVGTFNIGGGLNFWVSKSKNFGFQVQSMYKHSFDEGIVLPHFQHSVGIIIKYGGTDTDGDGIYDKFDKCKDTFGLKEFNGCPDTDGDGIIDSEDSCPNLAGPKELNGCPDADKDGIADKDDACPNVAGTKANNGCPDTDGDGVVDKDDACPSVAGPKANKGCPWPDTDGDGVLDKDDNCVDVAGPASNNGCPEEVISAAAEKQLNDFAKTINFNSNRYSFKAGVSTKLDAIVSIMKEYDRAKFSVNGYTDSRGRSDYNQKLSEKRAAAVVKYLVDHGVSADRLSSKGFGEADPIADNKTAKGRAENRRVEIKVVNKK